MELASFDIFDTTLIRKCGQPDNIFYLLANRLYPNDRALREDFLLWRKRAEQQARQRFPQTDVTLQQIYDNDELSGFTTYTTAKMLKTELEIESENLVVNPAIKKVIEKKRKEGYTVCFISDMYIDSNTLTEILRREGCLQDDEKVYVSCEWNARKSNGKLFDIVAKELSPSKWEHFGDNLNSDIKMPRKKSIEAHKIDTSFTDTEQLIIDKSRGIRNNYELSILAGLQRAARIIIGNNAYAEIAADFVAPAYIPYVFFLLKEAQARGLKRLYFLSRDSYILMKMAETLHDAYPEIELRYLFVSRKSLLLPYLYEVSVEQYLEAQDHHTIYRKNVNALLSAFETDWKEQKKDFGVTFDYSTITNKQQEKDFLDKILGSNSRYRSVLQERASKRRDLLLAYFRQEGLFDKVSSAMVDVGWLGTSRLMINSILKHSGARPVEFFYYGIRGDVLPSKYGTYSTFFRPNQLSTELTALVENYFSASPYPSTLKYSKSNGSIIPVFAPDTVFKETPITESNISITTWLMREMAKTGLNFEPILWIWTQIAINAISQLSVKINLTPFVKTTDFDDTAFVRKLSSTEMAKLILLGDHVTAFDRASLQLTTSRRLDGPLWRLHNFTGRIRRYLYLRLRK